MKISTENFIIFLIPFVFFMAMGIPFLFEYSTNYKVYPIKVTIIKNCCDTGYCIKSLDEKVITKVSTNVGLDLLKTKNIFFLVREYDVFGYFIKEEIEYYKYLSNSVPKPLISNSPFKSSQSSESIK